MECKAEPGQHFAWEYQLISEQCSHPDIGEYQTFGLRVFHVQQQAYGEAVSDISVDWAFVARLAALFNQMQLEPAHLFEVVADFVNDPAQIDLYPAE